MLNTGIFFVKTSAWSYWFFEKVRELTFRKNPITYHPWWDQTGIMYLLSLPFIIKDAEPRADFGRNDNYGHLPASYFLTQRHVNGYPPVVAQMLKTHISFEQGDFIISFSGCKIYSSQYLCNMLFVTYFTLVKEVADKLPVNMSKYFPY